MEDFKFIFDFRSPYWMDDEKYILMLIRMHNDWINNLLHAREYVYINQIYETFGVKWDADRENVCYRRRDCTAIDLNIRELNPKTYEITVKAHMRL